VQLASDGFRESNYEVSVSSRLPDLDISFEGKLLLVGSDPIRMEVIDPFRICGVSNASLCHLEVYEESYLDIYLNTFLNADFQIYGRSKFIMGNNPVVDEAVYWKTSFGSFQWIDYNISVLQRHVDGATDMIGALSSVITLYDTYNGYLPGSIRWFIERVSFYSDYAINLAWAVTNYGIREFGHTERLFSELTSLGASEGENITLPFLPNFISCDQFISFPLLTRENVSFVFLLTAVTIDYVMFKRMDYDISGSVSLVPFIEGNYSEGNRINGFITVADDGGSSIFTLNTLLDYHYSDNLTVVLSHENVQITILNKVLFKTNRYRTIPIYLGSDDSDPIFDNDNDDEPVILANDRLSHILDKWQFCGHYSTRNSDNALRNYATCRVTMCPGETVTVSLCRSDNNNISVSGDSYLRLTSAAVNGSSIDYAKSDDFCGLDSRISYEANITKCADFEIHEGCFSDGRCSGTVGVLLTADEPVILSNDRLSHILDKWQFCGHYSTRNSNNALKNYATCRVTMCPGETVTVSLCRSDNNNISVSGDSYLRLTSAAVNGSSIEYAKSDDFCGLDGLDSRISYEANITKCADFEIHEGCFSDGRCSGTVGVFLTASAFNEDERVFDYDELTLPNNTLPHVNIKFPRVLNTWQLCPSISHSGHYPIVTRTCAFAACPGDFVTVSGCTSDYGGVEFRSGYSYSQVFDPSGKASPIYRSLDCFTSHGGSTSSSYFIYGDSCQTYSIQTNCNDSCTGKPAFFMVNSTYVQRQDQIKVRSVLRRHPYEWLSCGRFSSTGTGFVHELNHYCQIEVCQWDTVFFSSCSSDSPGLFANGAYNLYYNDSAYQYSWGETCSTRSISVTASGCQNLTVSVVCVSGSGCSGNVGVKIEPHIPLARKRNDWKVCGDFSLTGVLTASLCYLKVCQHDEVEISFCSFDDRGFSVNQKTNISFNSFIPKLDRTFIPKTTSDYPTFNCFQANFRDFSAGCNLYTVQVNCSHDPCIGTAGVKYLGLEADSRTLSPTPTPSYKPVILPFYTEPVLLQYTHYHWLDCGNFFTEGTNSATQQTADCNIRLCPGDVMKASLCNNEWNTISCSGDTYLRIQDASGTPVVSNDDYCGSCSSLQFAVPQDFVGCSNYTVKQGCFSSDRCSGRTGVFLSSKLVCDAGSFANQYKCKVCPPGYFCPYNSTTPTICPTGSYCPLGTRSGNEYVCPIGTFNNVTGSQKMGDCITCSAGYYCAFQGITSPSGFCKGGYYCPAGTSTLIESLKCPRGTSCPTGSSVPVLCEAGTYQNETGSSTCKLCPTGNYCLSNATSPGVCPIGTFNNVTALRNESDCKRCPAGYYCISQGLSYPSGRCNDGYYCPVGTSTLVDSLICPRGARCPSGSSMPELCEAGKYQNETGSSTCKVCPTGNYCLSNTTTPTICPKGSYCPPGASYANQYLCPNGTRSELTGLQSVEQCSSSNQLTWNSSSAQSGSNSFIAIFVAVLLAFVACMIFLLIFFKCSIRRQKKINPDLLLLKLPYDDVESNVHHKKYSFNWQKRLLAKSEESEKEVSATMRTFSWNDLELYDTKLEKTILGQGSFGVVILARIKATGELVAVKCITSPTSLSERQKFEVSKLPWPSLLLMLFLG
jgi:hypothetical protein